MSNSVFLLLIPVGIGLFICLKNHVINGKGLKKDSEIWRNRQVNNVNMILLVIYSW